MTHTWGWGCSCPTPPPTLGCPPCVPEPFVGVMRWVCKGCVGVCWGGVVVPGGDHIVLGGAVRGPSACAQRVPRPQPCHIP